jgi:hypothetical protein
MESQSSPAKPSGHSQIPEMQIPPFSHCMSSQGFEQPKAVTNISVSRSEQFKGVDIDFI